LIGLFGRNGSGKSTLLKIIFGAVSSDSEHIRVNNQFLTNQIAKSKYINYLPQHHFLPKKLKVAAAIEIFCGQIQNSNFRKHHLIEPLLPKKIHQLSGGQLRILEVLVIVYSKAFFSLLDEPLTGISPIYKEDILKAIKENKGTKGFIITDHDYHHIWGHSNRNILLYQGVIRNVHHLDDLKKWGYI
jgi:ABC-type multidrug transport system ATPase subunit